MSGHLSYKICDSVHGFIRFNELEKGVIDSLPFQRLRYIHQMGVAYLIYPGATHSRFEHSLGVMELVSRVFDTMLAPQNLKVSLESEDLPYWRQILRLAALCHDLGHLPFSHTAERELLANGGHEKMTVKIIQSPEMHQHFKALGSRAEEDIIKLSVNEGELQELGMGFTLTPWQRVLSQVITEDNFGADRIDYLIRDARHTGVGYGHFDYHQLIDCLRIVPYDNEWTIGISSSGIQSVESLWIARYLMYARVYQHSKARVYSQHLRRFMAHYYEKRGFPKTLKGYLRETDFTVLTAVSEAAEGGDEDAEILMKRRSSYQELSLDRASELDVEALKEAFGEALFIDSVDPKEGERLFPVRTEEGKIISSREASPFLRTIPPGGKPVRFYVRPSQVTEVREWLGTLIAT